MCVFVQNSHVYMITVSMRLPCLDFQATGKWVSNVANNRIWKTIKTGVFARCRSSGKILSSRRGCLSHYWIANTCVCIKGKIALYSCFSNYRVFNVSDFYCNKTGILLNFDFLWTKYSKNITTCLARQDFPLWLRSHFLTIFKLTSNGTETHS